MTLTADRTSAVRVTRAAEPDDYLQIEGLYRTVFGIRAGSGTINARLLTAVDRHSGVVVVARQAGELVGFAFSFLARDGAAGRLYQYSQTAAVAPRAQGQGVGRALKQAQRRESLAGGVTLMRWAFDPMQARNAHFNLDVLGGEVRGFVRSMYGGAAPGRDSGDRTDRFVVEWELEEPVRRVERDLPDQEAEFGVPYRSGDAWYLPIPAQWTRYRAQVGLDRALDLRERVSVQFESALREGMVAVSCRRLDPERAVYVFRRRQPVGLVEPVAPVESGDR